MHFFFLFIMEKFNFEYRIQIKIFPEVNIRRSISIFKNKFEFFLDVHIPFYEKGLQKFLQMHNAYYQQL